MTEQVQDISNILAIKSVNHFVANQNSKSNTLTKSFLSNDSDVVLPPLNEPEKISIPESRALKSSKLHGYYSTDAGHHLMESSDLLISEFPDVQSSELHSKVRPSFNKPSPKKPNPLNLTQLKTPRNLKNTSNIRHPHHIDCNAFKGSSGYPLTNNSYPLANDTILQRPKAINLMLDLAPLGALPKIDQPLGLKQNKFKPKSTKKELQDSKAPLSEYISPNSCTDSPFATKYEEIIERFTGKLKVSTSEISPEISFSEDDIELQDEIGGGVSGTVYIVEHRTSKLKMAAKKMRWKPHQEEQKRILMDLEIMSIQKSPFIVFYYGSLVVNDNVWLYMELMDTCLDKVLKRHGPLPEQIVANVVIATLNALHYLKSVHDIIHRDVKPSNILINKKGNIKICDFGISKQLVESCVETRGAGPIAYISPERLDIDMKEYDVRADVWSLGISVIELLTGKLPYSHCKSDIEVMTRIVQEPPPRLPEILSVSQECKRFIELCLTKDYTKRPKYQVLLETSEFVKRYMAVQVPVAEWFASLTK
ncbi:Dual specificity mitogen-activated protein kinase kinase 7-like [Oopsacas minuta]|uniref:mitogen-activated protein kinase kinase n=1 Tax=Oopsacas minuta TaxID=111878 RepID=A0AAV7KE52_9METZ|nr:Dual specificity mitogen-activated protein kinase kinase 7-like [Oopsacas minuta]